MWLKRIGEQKGARAQAKELAPTTEFLFGGKVKDISMDLKASQELNPLAIVPFNNNKRGGHFRHGHGHGGRGAGGFSNFPKPRGRGSGSGSARGRGSSTRGDRLSKFQFYFLSILV